jgi:hypothetical protein
VQFLSFHQAEPMQANKINTADRAASARGSSASVIAEDAKQALSASSFSDDKNIGQLAGLEAIEPEAVYEADTSALTLPNAQFFSAGKPAAQLIDASHDTLILNEYTNLSLTAAEKCEVLAFSFSEFRVAAAVPIDVLDRIAVSPGCTDYGNSNACIGSAGQTATTTLIVEL